MPNIQNKVICSLCCSFEAVWSFDDYSYSVAQLYRALDFGSSGCRLDLKSTDYQEVILPGSQMKNAHQKSVHFLVQPLFLVKFGFTIK